LAFPFEDFVGMILPARNYGNRRARVINLANAAGLHTVLRNVGLDYSSHHTRKVKPGMKQQNSKEVFIDHIRDLYDAEKQLVKALPKLAKAASSEDLGAALRNHLEETQNHVVRLEEVFKIAGSTARGKTCKGMKGLVEEGSEAVQEHEEGMFRDLAIIAGGQKVEHYEMSAYGTARAMAEQLGMEKAAELLQQTEDEEKNADSTLTDIAMALYEGSGEDREGEEAGSEEEETTMTGGGTRGGPPKVRKAGS
jgi:ferritin-like metal-binding protein YciE